MLLVLSYDTWALKNLPFKVPGSGLWGRQEFPKGFTLFSLS